MSHVLAKDLREAVLQAAVQGKLSNKKETDSSVESIIKLLHFDSKIEKGEEPYDLPEHWRWIQIGNLGETNDTNSFADGPFGSNLKKEHQINEPEVRIIQLSNIGDGGWIDKNVKYTSYDHLKTISRCEVKPGDFVIAKMMPAGRTIIVPELPTKIVLGSDAVKFVPNRCLNRSYLLLAMRSNCFLSQVYSEVNGMTRVRTSLNKIKSYYLPLPPIEEQFRIVAKVDELMAKIDEYEKLEKELIELKEKFPGKMQDAIFQAAFSGNITERSKKDSDVETFLFNSEQKKAEYEKECKEKKRKTLREEKEFETLFDIPNEWRWAYVGDIFRHNAGKALNAKNTKGKLRKYITTSNVYSDHFELNNLREMYYTDEEIEKYSVKKGDLIVLEGGDCGRTALWNLEESYCIQNHLHRLRPFCECNIYYYFYLLSFYKSAGYLKGKGIAIQGLSANVLHNIIIPIPPVEEQQRIVEKLDKLLPMCDELANLC